VGQVDDDEAITMIDFPQMVSVSHRNAEMLVSIPYFIVNTGDEIIHSESHKILVLLKCQVF
jgi:archaellum component FlaG (FlaF/FlaG flagellin family)